MCDSPQEGFPEKMIKERITKKRASAVPSLKSDSPSNMSVNRLGAPSSLKSANTATGSVAEISEPKRNATGNGISIPKIRAQ